MPAETLDPAPSAARATARRPVSRRVALLRDAFAATCLAERGTRAALLVVPDGPDGTPRPLAAWPQGAPPPVAVVQASARVARDGREIDTPLGSAADASRLVAWRVEVPQQVLGVVALLIDGPGSDAVLARWRERLAAATMAPAPSPAADTAAMPPPAQAPVAADDPVAATPTGASDTAMPDPHGGAAPARGRVGMPASLLYRDVRPSGGEADAARRVSEPAEPALAAPRAGERAVASQAELARILECQAALAGTGPVDDALHELIATIARQHRCTRVAFGWAHRDSVRVEVLSDGVGGRPSAETVAPIVAAMEEALDQQACAAWPAAPSREMPVNVAQAQLARITQSGAVCTVPLAAEGEPVGALSLERASPAFAAAELVEFRRLASLLSPTLALRRRAGRPLRAAASDLRARLLGPRGGRARIAVVLLVAAAGAAFVDVTDRVGGTARVEGASQRALTAPADGWVARVHVRPGDAVKADQVLVELDDRDLALERLRWSTEAEQADRQATEAVAREDRGQYAVHAARAAQARAQLALVDAQLARQRVAAPFDGLVLTGDLTQQLGAPVKAGDVLLSVAPQGRHRVIVEVDERDVARVAPGAAATLSLAAHVGRTVPLTVVRIAPAAVARDGRTVFEVEAAPAAEAELRPGYQGVAKIEAGERALGRMLFERPWRALADRLWAWGW